MLNVLSCIKEREKYKFVNGKEDEWIEKLASSKLQDETFFVTTSGFAVNKCLKQRDKLLCKYHLAGIFELGAPYINTNSEMVLVHLVAVETATMKISVFSGKTFDKRENEDNNHQSTIGTGLEMPGEYLSKFRSYIKELEEWLNKGVNPEPDDSGKFEFNEVSIYDIDPLKLYPSYYTKQAVRLKEIINKEHCTRLSDVADIICPKRLEDNHGYERVLKPSNFTYPLKINGLPVEKPTSVVLQKGDIVFPLLCNRGAYLYNSDDNGLIFASESEVVIRSKKILPEFLYLYLNSDAAKQLLGIISTGITIKSAKLDDLKRLPIPPQSLSDEEYKRNFRFLTSMGSRDYKDYKTPEQLSEYYEDIREYQDEGRELDHIEDIFNLEVVENMRVYNEKQLRSFLTEDLNELKTCFRHKAYKSTLILAGSILEAILIDWLSDMDGKDYFNEEYIVTDRYTGEQKRHADLIDYIDAIKEIKRPKWMTEADEAHKIRKERNLVHAKLGINSDEVNEGTCREVIKYLEDIMNSRGVKQTILTEE